MRDEIWDREKESPPTQGAWIEIELVYQDADTQTSPPTQGAWIEIVLQAQVCGMPAVAPYAGGVD